MQTQTVIRAVDYAPKAPEMAEGSVDELVSETDSVVMRLFGSAPDYSKKEYESLWQEVFNADEQEMISYCLERGVDVLDDAKKPVSKWRDIAVMLKAIDKGIISLA